MLIWILTKTLKYPALSAYLRSQASNKNAQFNIYSTAAGYTETTTMSKEHVTLGDGSTNKTMKTTQQKINSLQFTVKSKRQASLSPFLIVIGVSFNAIYNKEF